MRFREYREWRPTYSLYKKNYGFENINEAHDRMSIVGLAAEAGELLALVQKGERKMQSIDRDKVVDELGDVLWYLCYVMDAFSISMDELTDFNKAKLEARNA